MFLPFFFKMVVYVREQPENICHQKYEMTGDNILIYTYGYFPQ